LHRQTRPGTLRHPTHHHPPLGSSASPGCGKPKPPPHPHQQCTHMHTCPRDVSHSRAAWLAHSRSSLSSLTPAMRAVPWRPEHWEGGRQPSFGASPPPLPSIQHLICMRQTGGTSASSGPEASGDSCSAAPLLPRLALGPLAKNQLWPMLLSCRRSFCPGLPGQSLPAGRTGRHSLLGQGRQTVLQRHSHLQSTMCRTISLTHRHLQD
jgi:hypothetical protein